MEEKDKYILKKTADNEVLVKFMNPMDSYEWNNFTSMMVRMLKNGFTRWKFILTDLPIATSIDIGMWVSCNATINNYSGVLEFIVKENSTIYKTLKFTNLDQIFKITMVKSS